MKVGVALAHAAGKGGGQARRVGNQAIGNVVAPFVSHDLVVHRAIAVDGGCANQVREHLIAGDERGAYGVAVRRSQLVGWDGGDARTSSGTHGDGHDGRRHG